MFPFRLALLYLSGRKLRTVLTTLAVVFGVMILFGLNGMMPAIQDGFRRGMLTSTNLVDLTVTSETRGSFDIGQLEKVRSTPGVAYATGSLVRPVVLPPGQAPRTQNNEPISSLVVSALDPVTGADVRPFSIGAGRSLQADDGNVMLVSDSLARKTGLKLGDKITLPAATGTTEFEIVGIVTWRQSMGVDEVFIPLKSAQDMLNVPGKINTIEALFTPGSDAEAVRRAVMDKLGPGYKLGGNEAGTEILAMAQIGSKVITMFGVLALAMAGFIIFNTFRTLVAERRRDIGVLRSLGASRRTIVGLILAESLLQGVIGTALGMVAGYLLVAGLLAAVAPMFEELMRFPIGGPVFSTETYLLSISLGVGVTLLGGLYPALLASRVSPLAALRPQVGAVALRAAGQRVMLGAIVIAVALAGLISGDIGLASLGAVLFLVGLVVIGPALVQPISSVFGRLLTVVFAREGHIAQGNLMRQPGRAAVTASSLMIGLAIVVAMAGVASSLSTGFQGWADKSLGTDYVMMPQSLVLGSGNVGAAPQLARDVRETPGIAEVTTLRMSLTKAEGLDVQVVGIDPVTYPKMAGLTFSAGDERQAYAEMRDGRALVANGVFAAQSGLKVGQELILQTPGGPQVYHVVGIGMDFLNAKLGTIYVSQANLEQDFHETTDLLIMANETEDADSAAVKAALQELVDRYPAFTLFAGKEWLNSMMQTVEMAMGLIYLLAAIVAIPSLIALVNTLAINVLERTREIGVLRAVGAARRQVQRMIVAESLLLSAIGVAFGLLSGLYLGYVLFGAMSVTGFVLPYHFPYAGLLVAVAAGLLLGVVAALLPARQAARLDIVAALHYE